MSEPANKPQITSLLTCATHGLQPGYVICSCCLLFSDPVVHFEPYTPQRPGEILCKRGTEHQPHEYRLVCRHCAKDMGVTRVGGTRTK